MLNWRLFRRCKNFSSIKDKIKKERLDRLKKESNYFPTKTNDKQDLIRNFGIIAHIDAGKTTTSERMLYYAGALQHPGEVHNGNTVMDYMPQERQRGITIRSAAISFNWNQFQYNLIDTPGHIDFTAEVERSLRVLDGAIAIFDGVSGVETQSETVWFQANRFNIPRIAFVNKLDRQGSNLELTLEQMKDKLNIVPLTVQIPLGESESFQGIIDIIDMQEITWKDKYGNIVQFNPITLDHPLYDKIIFYREQLMENIATFDDNFAFKYLEGTNIESSDIRYTIKQILSKFPLKLCPVLLGSALKNKGIQPLLDAVNQFLPSPNERPVIKDSFNENLQRQLSSDEKLCAFTYKIVNDAELGNLAYTRIYSGILQSKSNVMNSTLKQPERISNIFRVRADKYVSIQEASAGDIIALQGLKNCTSGCTINNQSDQPFVLLPLEMPQCVFFAGLEYESLKDKSKLEIALKTLTDEDTSLKITYEEGGQIIIGGLGELHLEIVQQRLKEQWNLNTSLKKMKVEYKESIQNETVSEIIYKDYVNNRPLWFGLKLKLIPFNLQEQQENEIVIDFPRAINFDSYYKEYKQRLQKKKKTDDDLEEQKTEKSNEELSSLRYIRNPCEQQQIDEISDQYGEEKVFNLESLPFSLFFELENQLKAALSRGALMSCPIVGIRACILGGQYTLHRSTELAVGKCVSALVQDALKQAHPIILEPVMNIQISTPNSVLQVIMNDLIGQRRGQVEIIEEDLSRFGRINSGRTLIKGQIPLQETIGYSTYIRSVSQGDASFNLSFKQYEFVGGQKQRDLIEGIF